MKISKDLRESIADAAIHGKLVEQNKAEGTASELLNKLSLHSAFDEDTDIPESWTFIKLENATVKKIARGKSPKYVENSSIMAFAQKCNLKAGGISLEQAKYWDEEKANKYKDEEFLHDNDIVINSTGGGTLGRVGQFHSDMLPEGIRIIPDSHVTTIRINPEFDYRYFYIYLKFNQPWLEIMGVGSTNQTELKPQVLKDMIVPLPPVAEQKRIVEKYYKLMKEIDELEKKENELEKLKTEFPEDMKASILQAAMSGKLTNSELKDELPVSWKIENLGNVITFHNGRAYKQSELLSEGKYKVLRVGNFFTNKSWYYSNLELDDDKYCRNGDLLYAWSASFGPKIWDGDKTIYHYHIWKLEFDENILYKKFLYYFLMHDVYNIRNSTTGTAMIHVSMRNMMKRKIVIPPLEEQMRIVAKLDELLPLCEGLKES